MSNIVSLDPTQAARQNVWLKSLEGHRNASLPGHKQIEVGDVVVLNSLSHESRSLDDSAALVADLPEMAAHDKEGNRETQKVLTEVGEALADRFGEQAWQVSREVKREPEGMVSMDIAWNGSGAVGGAKVFLHETPGVPGGLLYMEPLEDVAAQTVLGGGTCSLLPRSKSEQSRASVSGIIGRLGQHLPTTVTERMMEAIPGPDWSPTGAARMPNGDVVVVSMFEGAGGRPYESKVHVANKDGLREIDVLEGTAAPGEGYGRFGQAGDVITRDNLKVYLPGPDFQPKSDPGQRGINDQKASNWHRQLSGVLGYNPAETPSSVIEKIWVNGTSAEISMFQRDIKEAAKNAL